MPGNVSDRCYVQMSWTPPEFNNYICQIFPTVTLNVIGLYLARANKSKVLTKIQVNTMNELRAVFSRNRMHIIPQTSITLPLEVSFVVILGQHSF